MSPGGATFLAVALAVAPGAAAAPGLDGAALYSARGCPICHGAEGRRPARDAFPRLAGQSRAYLVQQLRDLRSGARRNGQARLMEAVVEGLSDAEIEAIAAWLAGRAP